MKTSSALRHSIILAIMLYLAGSFMEATFDIRSWINLSRMGVGMSWIVLTIRMIIIEAKNN